MKRILIANRGEIAIRLARGARELGLIPLGIASTADRHALHRRAMAQSLIIGPPRAQESYLDSARILQAARELAADAVHPGYGFLSEQAEFAEAVAAAGLIFIGPPPAALQTAGDKRLARQVAHHIGIPTLRGYDGADQSEETLRREAASIGYPILIKASNGGGGRGQRVVNDESEFSEQLAAAKREALAAFNDDGILLERYLLKPRHIEMQIAADAYGTIVALGERDCSLQRRRQKVLEEAPAFALSDSRRAAMAAAAIALAKAMNYRNLGTVEFLLEADGTFSFLEINARLQVEHPVTEVVTGVDLVQLQYRLARGEKMPSYLREAAVHGYALEARICAEDPAHDLLPSSGTITKWEFPSGPGIRVDAGYESGSVVPLDYDSLLAKVIVSAASRDGAYAKMRSVLAKTIISGIATNIPLLQALTRDADVLAGRVRTDLIDGSPLLDDLRIAPVTAMWSESELAVILASQLASIEYFRAADIGRYLMLEVDGSPVCYRADLHADGWRLVSEIELGGSALPALTQLNFDCAATLPERAHISVEFTAATGERIETAALMIGMGSHLELIPDNGGRSMRIRPRGAPSTANGFQRRRSGTAAQQTTIITPMPGRLLSVFVAEGEIVEDRYLLAIIEAMKMEHRIEAAGPGKIAAIHAPAGAVLAAGFTLFEIEPQ